MPPAVARRYQPADRADVLALGLDDRSIDQAEHRLYVVEAASRPVGVLVAIHPQGDTAILSVTLPALRGSLGTFHALLTAGVAGAIAAGYTEGEAIVYDRRIVDVLEARYNRQAEPSGYTGSPAQAVQWTFRVDLADLLEQLQRGP